MINEFLPLFFNKDQKSIKCLSVCPFLQEPVRFRRTSIIKYDNILLDTYLCSKTLEVESSSVILDRLYGPHFNTLSDTLIEIRIFFKNDK